MKSDWCGKQLWSNYLVRAVILILISVKWNASRTWVDPFPMQELHVARLLRLNERPEKKPDVFSLLMVFFLHNVSAPFKWHSKFQFSIFDVINQMSSGWENSYVQKRVIGCFCPCCVNLFLALMQSNDWTMDSSLLCN